MCITGSLGIPGCRKERTRSRNCFAGVFMGFSITSSVMGGVIIVCYSIVIANERGKYYHGYYSRRGERYLYDAKMAISAVILVLGVIEFVIGVWAAICCCLMRPCACCMEQQQAQQMAYTTNPPQYVPTFVLGSPVGVPVQPGGGMGAVQASGAQGVHRPMDLVPVSGTVADSSEDLGDDYKSGGKKSGNQYKQQNQFEDQVAPQQRRVTWL